jgi:hypothetical protein
MSKNKLGLRRSGGGRSGTPRISGQTQLGGHGLHAGANVKRPYLPDTPQDNVRDSRNTGRVDK